MISCTVERDNRLVNIEMHGHADYNPGNDIVCAMASILAYALDEVLLEYEAEYKVEMIKNEIESGELSLSFYINSNEIENVIDFFEVGIGLIAEQFPDNIEINTLI